MKRYSLLLAMILCCAIGALPQDAKTVFFHNPSWSPDGKRVVFESNREGKFAVFTIAIDGSGLRKLTDGVSNDEQPRWSRDGKRIVFISDRAGKFNVYVMLADGSRQTSVSAGNEGRFIPDLSPKGDMVAFASNDVAYLIGLDGKGETKLANGGEHLRWSPDGKTIMFSKTDSIPPDVAEKMPKMTRDERRAVLTKRDNSAEIYLMSSSGILLRKLTDNAVNDDGGEWSKNGRRIYFVSHREGAPKIFVMKANGTDARPIVEATTVTEANISPDERAFVYPKHKDGKPGIYIYDIAAKTERLLISQ